MASPETVDDLTRPAKTGGYAPHVYVGAYLSGILDGRPRFNWLEVERMRFDPQVQFGLRILRAPLYGATWKVSADRAAVGAWIDRELTHVYRRLLPRLVRMYEYGPAAGEVTFRARRVGGKTRVHFDDYLDIHPRDARPLVWERGRRAGKLAGLEVTGAPNGTVILDRRHGFWLRGEAEYGSWYGRPRLAGCYEPWLEKRGRHGAIDARRLFYKKCAFRGPSMRYPPGRTDYGEPGSPFYVSNQDIARELVEKFESGGVLAMPNVKGPTGDYLWSWEDPKSFSDVAGLLDYPKQLDREILIGLGVPPELVEAATVGSGYSGRAIPAQVFFTSMDEMISLLIEAIDRQIIRPLVRLNFGVVGYEIVPDSMAKMVASAPPGGAMPGGIPAPGAAGAGPVPYQGPRGGQGTVDPRTGKVHYHGQKPPIRLSLRDRKKKRKERGRRCRLSWVPYQGPRGGQGWVHDQTGEVRYQPDRPADDSTGGPESVFSLPEFAHIPAAADPAALAAVRARAAAAAAADQIDPAELHREAARSLHRSLGARVQYGDLAPAEEMAARADRVASSHADAAAVETARKNARQKRANYEAFKNDPAIDHDSWASLIKSYDDDVALAEESHGRHQQYRREAEEWRSGTRRHAAPDHAALLGEAYRTARGQILAARVEREHAADFAADYFAEDDAAARARAYLTEVHDNDLDAGLLPDDTRQAVTEDLVSLPPEELAAAVLHVAESYGTDDSPHWDVVKAAAAAAVRPAGPEDADWGDPGSYLVVTPDDVSDERWAGLQIAARMGGYARARTRGAMVVPADGPLGERAAEWGGRALDDDAARRDLFDRLKAPPVLAQADVPASARDFGSTSGALTPAGEIPSNDFNPNLVDVYKPVDETGNWYLLKRAENSPEADDSGETYAFVRRSAVPPLSRLPDAYWQNLNTDPGTDPDEVVRETARREKATPAGAVQKLDIGDHKKAIKEHRAEVGRLRQEWGKALKGVPEDERPEEPDWEGVDRSALESEHPDRDTHAAALSDLRDEYEQHVQTLQEAVDAAHDHGDEYRKAAGEKAERLTGLKSRWAGMFEGVPEGERPEEPDWEGGDPDDLEDLVAEEEENHGPEARAERDAHARTADALRDRYRQMGERAEKAAAGVAAVAAESDALESADIDGFNDADGYVLASNSYLLRDDDDTYSPAEKDLHRQMRSVLDEIQDEDSTPVAADYDDYVEHADLAPEEMDDAEELDPAGYASPREHAAALEEYLANIGGHLDENEPLLAQKEKAAAGGEYFAAAAAWVPKQAGRYERLADLAEKAAAAAAAAWTKEHPEDPQKPEETDEWALAASARATAGKLKDWAGRHRTRGAARMSLRAPTARSLWAAAAGPVLTEAT